MSMTEKLTRALEKVSKGEARMDMCHMINSGRLKAEKVIAKKSSSSSDVVFAQILANNAENVSLKIFSDDKWDYKHEKLYNSLLYEVYVYRYVIDNILKNEYSPNFVPYLGYSVCSSDTVQKLGLDNAYSSDMNILMTKRIIDSTTWGNFIKEESYDTILSVFFQLVYSLAVMGQFRLIHNDIHYGNILVKKLKHPVKMLFSSGKQSWVIKTKYIPYIFDWDRSYTEILGNNPINDTKICLEKNICNRFSSKFDLFVLLCTSLYSCSEFSAFKQLLKVILGMDKETSINKIAIEQEEIKITDQERKNLDEHKPLVRTRQILSWKFPPRQFKDVLPNTSARLGDKFFENIGGSITFNVYGRPGDYIITLESVHTCRPRMFDKNFPTPMELLHSKMWKNFESHDEEKGIEHKYTMPKPMVYKRIYVSPETPSTRHKIVGKPAFKLKKEKGGHISPEHVREVKELRRKYKTKYYV